MVSWVKAGNIFIVQSFYLSGNAGSDEVWLGNSLTGGTANLASGGCIEVWILGCMVQFLGCIAQNSFAVAV
jgi:Leu/Phe-tRNA-protein transferase